MSSTVCADSVVTLQYHVTDDEDEVVDQGREPLVYLHGGYEDIFAKIEAALDGQAIGTSVSVHLTADEAFGTFDKSLVEVEDRSTMPPDIALGMQLQVHTADEDPDDMRIYRVVEIVDDKVVLDANHPLAGLNLVFHCTVAGVRPASAQECSAGHAMQPA